MAAADVLAPDSESLEAKPKIQHRLQIMESHMPSAKEKAAIEVAISAVESNHHLMDIASHIKTKYDKLYPGSGKATEGVYHAMCGTHFASKLRPTFPLFLLSHLHPMFVYLSSFPTDSVMVPVKVRWQKVDL
jgi:hypothetical protein